MTANYKELAFRETDLIKQLNYLDSLLPQDHNQNTDTYPQLFVDQDSPFKPDFISGKNTKAIRVNDIEADSLQNKQQDDAFEQHLDTLQINQFLAMQKNKQCTQSYKSKKCLKYAQNSLQCTFKPHILKKSCQLADNLGPSFQRLTNSTIGQNKKNPYKPQNPQMKRHYSRQRMERLSKPRTLRTQPSQGAGQIKKPMIPRKSSAYPICSNLDIAARNAVWQQQKKQKIEKMRKQQQQNRIKKQSSSFKPKINNQYRGDKQVNLSRFGKQGMTGYFERVSMAKKQNSGKQIKHAYSRQSLSPYNTRSSRTPQKQNNSRLVNNKKNNTRVRYQEAVEELHKKLLSLNI